jgi:DNA-binding MarR family transcriptional regulator
MPSPAVALAAELLAVLIRLANAARSETAARIGDLTEAQLSILLALVHRGPLGITALAREQNVRTPTATVAIKRMERLGLVVGVDDPSDRRLKLAVATPEGIDRCRQALTARHRALVTKLDALPAADRARLADAGEVLARLTAESAASSTQDHQEVAGNARK